MADNSDEIGESRGDGGRARYEYRVWGRHARARARLAEVADSSTTETIEDCYLLDAGDPDVNAKVRADVLKVKQRVGWSKGFDRWVARRHRSAATAPAPYDELVDLLRLHESSGGSYDLAEHIDRLDADHPRAVFVTKRRVRYRVGPLRAEVTDITIDDNGEVLRTLAIEGADLDALVALRKRLGLAGEDNIAVHEAIHAAL